MKRFDLEKITAAAFIAMSIAACGGGSDLDRIRQDFDHPTGDVSDRDSLIALNGKRSASEFTGSNGLTSGQGIGLGLSAAGHEAPAFRRIAPRVMFNHEVEYMRSIVAGTWQTRQGLRTAEDFDSSACVDEEAIARSVAGIDPRTGGSGSFSYSVDLDACTQGILTGRMDLSASFTISRTHAEFNITEKLIGVCETAGDKACVDGEYKIEMVMDMNQATREVSVSFIAGWDIDASWDDNGVRREAHVKGGLRLAGEGNDSISSGSFEYLYYVTTPEGKEVSFVLRITGDSSGNATMTIIGRDGKTIECTYSEAEGGRCVGPGGEITWDAAAEQAVYESDWFKS